MTRRRFPFLFPATLLSYFPPAALLQSSSPNLRSGCLAWLRDARGPAAGNFFLNLNGPACAQPSLRREHVKDYEHTNFGPRK